MKKPTSRLGHILTWIKKHQVGVAIGVLLTLGFTTRFFLFGYPNQAVFDEVYFGKFVGAYFSGQYYFDIHPPFAKLLIATFAKLMGYNPTSSFAAIGTAFTDSGYLYLRFLPSLAGALLPLVLFSIAREFGLKTRTAFLVGMLTILDAALLAQSRFILIDSLLLLFSFASLWLYLVWRRSQQLWILILAAALVGMAISVKWIALPFMLLPLLYEFLHHASFKRMFKILTVYVVVAVSLYVAFFAIHVSLLTKSGDGDAFMSQAYQISLEGNPNAVNTSEPTLSVPEKIAELNHEMYAANARLTAGHPYGSKWYGWPVMIKPISYWIQGNAQIWLVGNPIVWWGGAIAIIWLLIDLLTKKVPSKKLPVALFIVLGFFMAWLPFALISRVMFLYHYFIPLCFSILAIGYCMDRVEWKMQLTLLLLAVAGFILFAPAAYGLELSQAFTNIRNIIPGWQ
ncbi:MAG: Dolichyl-phosphate-mannose--protein mannosyltransferase [Patescibacteria group bacterium]|jgi:dolichyl-phosphate-mannose-protein mannosyltransferase|nr:Dolichyl-phosphate-mannose--protein mannosyltransferase [Patescibacteria group bacterium]